MMAGTKQRLQLGHPLVVAVAEFIGPIIRAALADSMAELAPAERPPALLTRAELARELRCCTKTVARLERARLPFKMLAGSPRYELATVLEWWRSRP